MFYVREFSSKTWLGHWLSKTPELKALLKSFGIGLTGNVEPPSVFRCEGQSSELETVAALCQRSRTSERTHLIRVALDDINSVGIRVDTSESGRTGIRTVDVRHANLHGSREQFQALVERVLTKIWEGDNRLNVFSELAILGELARLSKLSDGIDEGARERCMRLLERRSDNHRFESDNAVSIISHFAEDASQIVEARRHFGTPKQPVPRMISSFVRWLFGQGNRGR